MKIENFIDVAMQVEAELRASGAISDANLIAKAIETARSGERNRQELAPDFVQELRMIESQCSHPRGWTDIGGGMEFRQWEELLDRLRSTIVHMIG